MSPSIEVQPLSLPKRTGSLDRFFYDIDHIDLLVMELQVTDLFLQLQIFTIRFYKTHRESLVPEELQLSPKIQMKSYQGHDRWG